MKGELEKAELQFTQSVTTALFWVIRQPNGDYIAKNGSAFFLHTGERLLGVTANHVIEGWQRDQCQHDEVHCFLGGQASVCQFRENWLIDRDIDIDIATFDIALHQIKSLGRTVLEGVQKSWPPTPPVVDGRIYYCGFPGSGRSWPSREISFSAVVSSGAASSVSETDLSILIDRETLHPMLGQGVPPEDFDYRGMSGGVVLTIVEEPLHSWALAGVIYQGPNPSDDTGQAIAGLSIIKARRAHFIRPDGKLDRARWHAANPEWASKRQ